MTWKLGGPEGNETAKVHDRIAPFVYGHGVDLGCGFWKLAVTKSSKHSCLGIDGGYEEQPGRAASCDVIADVTNLSLFTDEAFDYVYSSHTLEDLPYTEAVLMEWWRLVKPGGNLILYLPLTKRVAKEMGLENWADFYPNMGEEGANYHHQHDFHPQEIRDAIARIGRAEVLADEIRGDKDEYSFLLVFRKLAGSAHPSRGLSVLPAEKRAIVIRYGAIGDCIQTVPVLRKLKEEGYHVTVNCSEAGRDVFKYSPYVDEVAVQIRDYVENKGVVSGPLAEYWKELESKYDRYVNLTGAAEESLLLPDAKLISMMEATRTQNPGLAEKIKEQKPDASEKEVEAIIEENVFYACVNKVKEQVGETNYYDAHLAKAGYADRGINGELFFSEQEEIMAQGFRDKYAGRFVVMWVLSGSSYHKRYPFFQEVAQELIVRNSDILLISVGDPECALVERAESNRYLPRAGRWQLRTSLVMTKYVDLVIGPETGILNAAGCFETPKITFLSHSSHSNLCKYWKNDFCLAPPEDVRCHPCHILHYIHDVNAKCSVCQSTHSVAMQPTPNKQFGGMWTCPYKVVESTKDAKGYGVVAPLCTAQLDAGTVYRRIAEVYALWKEKTHRNALVAV